MEEREKNGERGRVTNEEMLSDRRFGTSVTGIRLLQSWDCVPALVWTCSCVYLCVCVFVPALVWTCLCVCFAFLPTTLMQPFERMASFSTVIKLGVESVRWARPRSDDKQEECNQLQTCCQGLRSSGGACGAGS